MCNAIPVMPRFTLVVAKTLDLDGAICDGTYEQSKKKSLADSYDYVMHGQVYVRLHHSYTRGMLLCTPQNKCALVISTCALLGLVLVP